MPESGQFQTIPNHSLIITLLILWALLFLGHNWEEGMKMDGMTNSILAKHILSTGDWKIFHYTSSAYPDYYPHPPLAVWTEAILFKLFGVSDFTARLSPALFGLGTVAGVVYWGALSGSIWEGFLAAFILLTSSRYIKYAADAFLEGPLAFWIVWGGVFFLKSQKITETKYFRSKAFYSAGLGICLGAAFLTKSIFALSLPFALAIAALTEAFLFPAKNEKLNWSTLKNFAVTMGIAFLFLSLVLACWFVFGDGISFLKHHWIDIRDRVSGKSTFLEHLDPAYNLLRTYLPWLPLFLFCTIKIAKNALQIFQNKAKGKNLISDTTRTALLISLIIFSGLIYSGFFFEHYLVPFYPMAALVIAPFLANWLGKYQYKIHQGIRAIGVCIALVLAIFPVRLHSSHTEPLTELLSELPFVCSGQKEVLISDQLMEQWMALAVLLWKLPSEAASVNIQNTVPKEGQLLITKSDENPDPGQWLWVPLHTTNLGLYQPRNFPPLCK